MRKHLTYANVVSTLALFVVIAGGTAAALPGKGSVQSNDLKKNAVKAAAIAKKAIRSAEIKNGAIKSADVADGGLAYGDLGSNSVIARMSSTASVQTGDGGTANPVDIPISGASWTQGPNETDVLFGEITYTQPPTCTMGFLRVELRVDGQTLDVDTYGFEADPGETVTETLAQLRPYVFESGSSEPHTLTVRASDTCGNAGEQFAIQGIKLNVVAVR